MRQKPQVYHPINMFNTVGQEVEKELLSRGKNPDDFMPVEKLRARIKFSDKEIEHICDLAQDKDLAYFIRDFQEDYAQQRIESEITYAQAIKAFHKLECLLPLMEDDEEFNQGRSLLEDILDFLGVEKEEEVFAHANQLAESFHLSHHSVRVEPVKLFGWMRRGELDFHPLFLYPYDHKAILNWIHQSNWRQQLENIDFVRSLPQKLSEMGVAVIISPFLEGTIVEGETEDLYITSRWIDKHPLVQAAPVNCTDEVLWTAVIEEIERIVSLNPYV